MNIACIDTSCLVAVLFGEPGGTALARRLQKFDEVLASALLESELMAAAAREGLTMDDELLAPLRWILPDRSLGAEIRRILRNGYLRGADCWHLACALYVFDDPSEVTFLTLDIPQRAVARALGFLT